MAHIHQGRAPIMLRLDLSANGVEAVDGVAAELAEGLSLAPPPPPAPVVAAAAGAVAAPAGGGGGGGVWVLDALWAAALCGMPHLMELELRDSGGACGVRVAGGVLFCSVLLGGFLLSLCLSCPSSLLHGVSGSIPHPPVIPI